MKTLSTIAVSPFGFLIFKDREANNPNVIYKGRVRGIQYYQAPYMYHHLKEGSELVLAREQDNMHDTHAVAVYYKHFMLGFLPASQNEAMAHLLDCGVQLKAVITHIKRRKFMPPTNIEIEVIKNV